MTREGMKNSDLPPIQGCTGEIDGDKPSILKPAVDHVYGAAHPDKARDGFFQGFPKLSRLLLWLMLAAGIGLAIAWRDRLDAELLSRWVHAAGIAGPLLFMGIYAIATLLFLPGSILTLAGGALFGPWWGTFYNLTGATLGAALAFLAARHLAGDWAARRTGGRLRQLVGGVEQEGWRFVAFARLVPLFPFNLLNYALGLTRIRFGHYLLASYLFMLPGAFAYTWLGYAGREAMSGGEGMIQKVLIGLALLAALGFVPRLASRLRQPPWLEIEELKERIDNAEGIILDVRPVEEFLGEQGHIPGALNIPLERLAEHLDQLGDDLQRPIAIVCRTDRRSAKAATLLYREGFRNARVVRGGMTAWLERGWPVLA